MDESDQANKINSANTGQPPQVLRTQTLAPPIMTTFAPIASSNTQPRPVVIRQRRQQQRRASYTKACRTPYLSYGPRIMHVWDWTGVRVEGKGKARCGPEILELACVGPEAGWGTRVGIVQRYVVVFSLALGV